MVTMTPPSELIETLIRDASTDLFARGFGVVRQCDIAAVSILDQTLRTLADTFDAEQSLKHLYLSLAAQDLRTLADQMERGLEEV